MLKKDANWGLLLKGGLLSSSIISVGAAICDSWNYAQMGVIGGAIFVTGMIFRAGFNSTSNHLERKANEIQRVITTIDFDHLNPKRLAASAG